MTECRRIESLLPPYVDGEATPDEVHRVESHLASCDVCQAQVVSERTARTILRARASELATPSPPGLRTRIAATVPSAERPTLGWGGRLSALGAAAAVLVFLVVALEFVPLRSNVLFAAQLAIDHVRCFVVEELGMMTPTDASAVERQYRTDYGWNVRVPPSSENAGVTLMAARRCPFWLGDHAHVLYRFGDRDVSLYVTQGQQRTPSSVAVLGHVERIWSTNGNTYAVVARSMPAGDLDRIAAYFEASTR
jgi:anti-sigma factor RsiW